jgi:sugar/nucleoside kinase (ribokinase family)
MTSAFDVAAVGNAIVDVLAPATDAFLAEEGLTKGAMMLIDAERANGLYGRMAAGVEASGGSAGNTVAGVASLGGRAAYVGKVADDALGEVFRHDITAIGVRFEPTPLRTSGPGMSGEGTGRCLVNVTGDGQRTMCTYLGAANALTPDDVDADLIASAEIIYLEGYLFDPPAAREAFAKAAAAGRKAGRRVALSLSDAFVVERHRGALLDFLERDTDIVFANEAEALSLVQGEDFDAALRALAARVETAVVTRGAAGSVIVTGGQTYGIPAAPVDKVVDTTGAGDQYAAGVLYGLARRLDPQVSGRLGALAAAEVIGHFGPRPLTPLKALAEAAQLI